MIIKQSFFSIIFSEFIWRSILTFIAEIDIVEQLRDRKFLFFITEVISTALGKGFTNSDFLNWKFWYFFEKLLSSDGQVVAIFIFFLDWVAMRVYSQLFGYAFFMFYLKFIIIFLHSALFPISASRRKSDISLRLTISWTVLTRVAIFSVLSAL